MELTLNERKIVRKLIGIVNEKPLDRMLMYLDSQNRIVRANDEKVGIDCNENEFRAIRAVGFVSYIGTASTGTLFNLDDSAHLAIRNNFGSAERLDVLRAFYELSGEARDEEVYAKDAAELVELSIGKVKSAMRSLNEQGLIGRDGRNDTFNSPRDPFDRDWYISGRGITAVEEPQPSPPQTYSFHSTNFGNWINAIGSGNVVVGDSNTITQGISGSDLAKMMGAFLEATNKLVETARSTANAELVQKIEDAANDIEAGKESGVAKVAGVVKSVGELLEAGGKSVEGVTKIAGLMALLHPWLHAMAPLIPFIH